MMWRLVTLLAVVLSLHLAACTTTVTCTSAGNTITCRQPMAPYLLAAAIPAAAILGSSVLIASSIPSVPAVPAR